MIKEKNPLQELFEPAVCGTTHKTVEKIQTNQELTLIWATVDHISVRLIRGVAAVTFLPVSSIGLLHASCLAEILEQVYQTLLPVPLERVILVKPRLPRLDLKTPAHVPVKGQIEVPAK